MRRRKRPLENGNRKNKKQKQDDDTSDEARRRHTSVDRHDTIKPANKVLKTKTPECAHGLKTEPGHSMITRKKKRDMEKLSNIHVKSNITELKHSNVDVISPDKSLSQEQVESNIQQKTKSTRKIEEIVKKLVKISTENDSQSIEAKTGVEEENCNVKQSNILRRCEETGTCFAEIGTKESNINKTEIKQTNRGKLLTDPLTEGSEIGMKVCVENHQDKRDGNMSQEAQLQDVSTKILGKKHKKHKKRSHLNEIYKPTSTSPSKHKVKKKKHDKKRYLEQHIGSSEESDKDFSEKIMPGRPLSTHDMTENEDSVTEHIHTIGTLDLHEHQHTKEMDETTEPTQEIQNACETGIELEMKHQGMTTNSNSPKKVAESYTSQHKYKKDYHKTRTVEQHVNFLDEEDGRDDSEKIMPDRPYFQFELDQVIWNNIKPISKTYSNGRVIRRMGEKWTDVFQDEVNKHYPGCVLKFKTHHVKSVKSRKKSGAFLLATAYCKGNQCHGVFHFEIEREPNTEDGIFVNCTVSGRIMHSVEEVNRRPITGNDRERIGLDIRNKSASKVYYENVLACNSEQMSLGNYTSVPNENVLRKIVSEIMKKEQLHSNILAELQVLKESYDKSHEQYIRDIGYDPFYLIMFSDEQIQLLTKLSEDDELYIYLDATGSVISNIVGQKRPYLYSFVVKPRSDLPPVSLADMVSTQHTIPRIELFLSSIKRAVCVKGKILKVKKVETDYSLALVQACLHTFSNLSIKSYLLRCMDIIKRRRIPSDLTVHHLCAAHMIKDFSRQLTKYKPKTKKKVRKFILKGFAALQNATSLHETKTIYRYIATVLSSSKSSKEVQVAIQELKEQFITTDVCDEDDEVFVNEDEYVQEDVEEKTIRNASPFTELFERVTSEIIQQCATENRIDSEDNALYCPEALQCLLEKFMPIVPMWNGMMLNICSTDKHQDDIISRDTNSPAENWFKYIKCDIKTPMHARPHTFVTNLREAIRSRLIEHSFPGCRKKKTRTTNKKETDAVLNTKEELWKPRRKKGVYHTTPKTKNVQKNTNVIAERTVLPRVMKWGGKLGETVLSNTCTIDNVLTILHLQYSHNEQFQYFIQNDGHSLSQTLLTVFKLMSEEQFAAAKIVWVDYTGRQIKPSINLYGDEYDLIITYIDNLWKSMTVSRCDNQSCMEPMKESREVKGITVGISTPLNSIQELLNKWLEDIVSCKRDCSRIDEPFNELEHDCQGIRTVHRRILEHPPILVVRVYEHCLMERLSVHQIIRNKEINVAGESYCLAGLTLHKGDHYTAIVSTKTHGSLWFDGLIGELRPLPQNLDTWFPSHVFFGRVR